MPNTWFRFKQFTVNQAHAAMKVGTDGVLLGAWASVPGPQSRILDVGTGTGLIALMLAQRTRDVYLDALEIDPSAARQAAANFENSPWKDRLSCIRTSFQAYASRNHPPYDQIICNPPFFTASRKTPSQAKNLARHDDSLNLKDFFAGCSTLGKNSTLISLILPADKEEQARDLVEANRMYCTRLNRVFPAPGKPCKRLLMECRFLPGACREETLTIETGTRHCYTEEFKNLVAEFYL